MPIPPIAHPADTVIAQSLGSGSSGNALLIRAGGRSLLVDCGIGVRKLRSGLAGHELGPDDLDAVLITHEHRDHVQTLPKLLRDDLPIIATRGTADRAGLPLATTQIVESSSLVGVAGATVHALAVRHDACDPCGFHIEIGGARITVLTDLGSWQDHLFDAVAESDLVLIEANYNPTMLRHGPYPARLKRRVGSDAGHLGNDACGQAIAAVLKSSRLQATWWLSHLSQTNNSPRQAERDVREALTRANTEAEVTALPRTMPGPLWTFSEGCRRLAQRPVPVSSARVSQLGLPGLD
jgi:phosphoribosyl 1,2-cyclic phosphodiesterase